MSLVGGGGVLGCFGKVSEDPLTQLLVNLLGLPCEAGLAPGEQKAERSLSQDGPVAQS